MNDVNFTQLASDGKQYAHQPFNETFDRFEETSLVKGAPCRVLNDAFRAMQGIEAIVQMLIANSVTKDMDEGPAPLAPSLENGMLVAAQMLAKYAGDDIDSLADWSAKYAPENAHG